MELTFKNSLKHATLVTCAITLSSLSLPSFAIDPYQVTYKAAVDGYSGTLTRSLTQIDGGQWLFRDEISALIASIDQSSVVDIANNKVQPHKYHYLRKVFGKKKKRDVKFDWTKNEASNRDNKIVKLIDNSQDRLSYQLQLQIDLQNKKSGRLTYPVVRGSSIETYTFVKVGTENVKTDLGNLKSVKYKIDRGENAKRETFIWFSIDHNYVISKFLQTESNGKSYSMTLNKLS